MVLHVRNMCFCLQTSSLWGPPLKSPYFGARLKYKADAKLYPPLFGLSVLQVSLSFALQGEA